MFIVATVPTSQPETGANPKDGLKLVEASPVQFHY